MSTLKVDTLSNIAGTASTGILNAINGTAKAWVNFNGIGTVAIRSSYNTSSITDNGVGDFTMNFTTAMSTADYVALFISTVVGTGYVYTGTMPSKTAAALRFTGVAGNGVLADWDQNYCTIFT